MNYGVFKNNVKERIKGKWIMLFVILIIFSAANYISSEINDYVSIVVSFILYPASAVGVYHYVKNLLLEGKEDAKVVLEPYKDLNYAVKIIGLNIIVTLIVILGCVLLIVPGIYFALQYSQANYILADNKEISISEAMRRSKEMMNGHKIELLGLCLSFIPNVLLLFVTCGIYYIYFIPYSISTMVAYYLELVNLNDKDTFNRELNWDSDYFNKNNN